MSHGALPTETLALKRRTGKSNSSWCPTAPSRMRALHFSRIQSHRTPDARPPTMNRVPWCLPPPRGPAGYSKATKQHDFTIFGARTKAKRTKTRTRKSPAANIFVKPMSKDSERLQSAPVHRLQHTNATGATPDITDWGGFAPVCCLKAGGGVGSWCVHGSWNQLAARLGVGLSSVRPSGDQ